MGSGLVKLLLLVLGVGSVAASTYALEQMYRSDKSFQVTSSPDEEEAEEEPAEHGARGSHEAKAEGGEHGEGGEAGEGGRKVAESTDPNQPVIVAMEQTFANVLDEAGKSHSLMLKLDVELFEESQRLLFEERDAVIKSTLIETSREHSYEALNTVGGKAYFKESLVSHINEALQNAVVRDIHFNTFYMQ